MNHDTILRIIQARVADPIAIYLFGSTATGAVHESSDIDLDKAGMMGLTLCT